MQTEDNRIKVTITNNQTLAISNVRVNGDIFDEEGNLITQGAGIELTAEQVASLGQANVQGLADIWNAQQNPEKYEE